MSLLEALQRARTPDDVQQAIADAHDVHLGAPTIEALTRCAREIEGVRDSVFALLDAAQITLASLCEDSGAIDLRRAIRESPDEDAPRLVYADWLEERGIDLRTACLLHEAKAAGILGLSSVHGLSAAEEHFGVLFAREHLAGLAHLPFREETLRECKGTHLLVAGHPCSLQDLLARHRHLFFGDPWYADEPIVKDERVASRWYLLRKEPLPQMQDRTYDEQLALQPEQEEVPKTCELTYVLILHYLATGTYLFPRASVRSSTPCHRIGTTGRVVVGGTEIPGFRIGWDGDKFQGSVGLASARKPDRP